MLTFVIGAKLMPKVSRPDVSGALAARPLNSSVSVPQWFRATGIEPAFFLLAGLAYQTTTADAPE
jgi:hypothetical protein